MFAGASLYCPVCGDTFSPLCERCPEDGVALTYPPRHGDPLIGRVLDRRFRVLHMLAQGAMGSIYEGVQLPIKRPVAIKVIRDELTRDAKTAQRFLREAQLLTRIAHPNIVDVLDFGETPDGCLFLVMELLRGQTLDVALAQRGPFSIRQICELGLQLCDALVAAHAHGVIHRDLKPANIFLMPELGDWVKILDFGLAKTMDAASELTYIGAVLGTPLYMAPETIRFNAAGPRSDLYALGCILFELSAGRPPFAAATLTDLVLAHVMVAPPAARHLPAPVAAVIECLLSKEPSERYQTASELRSALDAAGRALEAAHDRRSAA